MPRAAAVLLATAIAACLPSALGRGDVCDFPMTSMYVPDARQKQFPVGFLGCVDVANVTLPRCRPCDCREIQSVRNGGNVISWGVCVEGKNATPCPSQYCSNETTSAPTLLVTTRPPVTSTPTTTAPTVFRPGRVQAQGEPSNSTMKQEAMNAEDTLSSTSSGSSASRGTSSTPIVIAAIGTVAAVGAIAVFAFTKARKDEEGLGTPEEDNFKPYKDTKPSKQPPSSRPHAPQYQTMLQPPPFQTQPPSLKQPPAIEEPRHDTTSDEEHEQVYPFDDSQRSDFSALNMDTLRSLSSDIDDSDEYDDNRGSRLTVDEEDEEHDNIDILQTNDSTLSSEYWRDSNDSMLFSNSSALSLYIEEKPRKSNAF